MTFYEFQNGITRYPFYENLKCQLQRTQYDDVITTSFSTFKRSTRTYNSSFTQLKQKQKRKRKDDKESFDIVRKLC